MCGGSAAAVVLIILLRPWRRRWTRRTGWRAVTFGVVLTGMNFTFCLALEHLPLGTAVAVVRSVAHGTAPSPDGP